MRKLRWGLILALLGMVMGTGGVAAEPEKPSVDVLLLGYYVWVDEAYQQELEKDNIYIYQRPDDRRCGDPALYPLDYLRKFNVVVVSGPIGRRWSPCVVDQVPEGMFERLMEYRRAGGSLVWIPLGADHGVVNWNEVIGSKIGAEALDEDLDGPSNQTIYRPGASAVAAIARYNRTSNVSAHPITEGVKNLFFCRTGEWGFPGTIPMKYDANWRVLVRGDRTTRSVRNEFDAKSAAHQFKMSDRTGTYAEAPALVAIREATPEEGAMVVFPSYSSGTWGNYNHVALGNTFLYDGDGNVKSDGDRLVRNLFSYLGASSRARGFGGYRAAFPPPPKKVTPPDLSPVKWAPSLPEKLSGGPQQRGLIGARTAGGGGSGTVAEWVQAARAAGLNFLVFVEDPARYDEASYLKFVEACKKESTPDFAAVPGYGAYDTSGAYRFYVNALQLPGPSSGFLNAEGRIAKPIVPTTLSGWGTWPSMAEYAKMPYNPWWNWVNASGAMLVYDQGKLSDNGIERWLQCCEPNSCHLVPLSLVRMTRPAEVAEAAKNAHLTVIFADRPDKIATYARWGAGGGVMPTYLTNGPKLEFWSCQGASPSPWRPNSDRFRGGVVITSPVGLREVKLVDRTTGRVLRDWRPEGAREFRGEFDLSHNRQQVISLEATDVEGHTLYAPPLYSYLDGNRLWHMSDRLMGMHHQTNWTPDGSALVGNVGGILGISYHKGAGGGTGGSPGSPQPGRLKIQGLDGGSVYAPDMHLDPRPFARGMPEERRPYRFYLRLAAHDLAVVDRVADQRYTPAGGMKFQDPIPPLEPVDQAEVRTRTWGVRLNPEAPYNLANFDITFTFKRDLTVERIALTRNSWRYAPKEYDHWFLQSDPKTPRQEKIFTEKSQEKLRSQLNPGGYVYQVPVLGGAPTFIVREAVDPVTVITTVVPPSEKEQGFRGNEMVIEFPGGRAFKAGETYTISLLFATRMLDDEQSSGDWVEQMLCDYGVGRTPAYAYRVEQGKLRGINYFFDVDVENGGAVVAVDQYPLPHPLPVRIHGVSKNAVVGEYNLLTRRVRLLPNFEQMVLSSIDPRDGDRKYFYGEVLTWNNDELVVNLVPEETDFLLEAHNPTDRPIRAVFEGGRSFAPLAGVRLEREIAPHATLREKIASAPDTVKLVPFKW